MSWEILYKKEIKDEQELFDVLLKNRGIKGEKDIEKFLNPKHPADISYKEVGINQKDLEKSLKRIEKAIEDQEQIIIYGDYDADGICATAIAWEALHKKGAKVLPFIPDRFEDGYGINPASIKKLKTKYPTLSLIITVDNGIVAYDAIEVANEMGIDVVVTDHHTKGSKANKAYSIVHTTELSGAGIAWFLAKELISDANSSLELAAIGTIADQLPLVGANRSLAKFGLESINKTNRVGLKKLLLTAGLLNKKIGTYEINFMIAPRINAAGRIGDAMNALRLLCTTNSNRAQKLALQLNELNLERQGMVEEALKLTESVDVESNSIILSASENYHEGVIGLIASKLTERHSRPAIVLSIKQGFAKASARSVEGFNIIAAVRAYEELIIEGGGHEMAAGFSIKLENIKLLHEKLNEFAKPLLAANSLNKRTKVDCILSFKLLSLKLYNMLSQLEPYGSGNPAPSFLTKDVVLVKQKSLGSSGKHLKLTLEESGASFEALLFNYEKEINEKKLDVVYKLSLNEWQGKKSLELMLKELKKHE